MLYNAIHALYNMYIVKIYMYILNISLNNNTDSMFLLIFLKLFSETLAV